MRGIFLFVFLLPTLLFASSDLQLKSLRAVLPPGGTAIQLQLLIQNAGPDNAENVSCNIYLYSNQKLIVSQTMALSPEPAQKSKKEQLDIDMPSESVSRVKVEIYDSQQPDTQPSNNFSQVNITAADTKSADLEIVEAAIESVEPVKDANVQMKLRLRNNGPDLMLPTKITANLLLYGKQVGQAEKRIGKLAVGAELNMKLAVGIPQFVSSSDAYVQIQWVVEGEVQDPNLDNNAYDLSVTLHKKMPDLLSKDVAVDARGTFGFTVENKGNAPADNSTTALYLNGALVWRYKTPALQPGGSRHFSYDIEKLESGTQVLVVIDFNADVEESSEENNRIPYTVK